MMDLEVAGDFILMASTLMHIKVRLLLPREIDEKGDEIDPRAELIEALLQYKKYKEMSEELSFFETNQRKINFRNNFSKDEKETPPDYEALLKNVTIFDLAKAFKNAIDRVKPEIFHEIKSLNITIDEQIEFILSKLDKLSELHFLSIVDGMKEKIRIVITFVALLELTKMGMIGIKESANFNDFVIIRINDGQHIQFNN